jgi:hypothetical protein
MLDDVRKIQINSFMVKKIFDIYRSTDFVKNDKILAN